MRPISVGKNLTGGTKTTLYTVPAQYLAKWNLLYVTNNSASSKTISAWWYDKSENTEVIVTLDYPLTAKNFLKIDSAYTVLEEGDEIRVQSETGSTASAIITVEQEYMGVKQRGF
jgi:hypothetical protein